VIIITFVASATTNVTSFWIDLDICGAIAFAIGANRNKYIANYI